MELFDLLNMHLCHYQKNSTKIRLFRIGAPSGNGINLFRFISLTDLAANLIILMLPGVSLSNPYLEAVVLNKRGPKKAQILFGGLSKQTGWPGYFLFRIIMA